GRKGGRLSNVRVAHNTILNSTEQAVSLGLRGTSKKSYIENNLLATSQGGEMAAATGTDGIVWRHNLWSSFPGEAVYNPSSDVVSEDTGLINIDAPVAAGALEADPYKLVETSVAINRGIRRNGEALTDFWGTPRDNAPDIGASEF